MDGNFLLALLFLLTIGHLVTLKICSVALDHKTAPLFISGWTLLGLLCVSPFYGHLLKEGLAEYLARPHLFLLSALKGGLLYLLFVISQELMKVSLSSRHYVTPLAIGLIAVTNSFFGENLLPNQWLAILGLFALSAGFFLKGHLSDLDTAGKRAYAKLVGLSVLLSSLDHVLTRDTNWFTLLLVSNVALLAVSLAFNARNLAVMRAAAFHRAAALAGVFYATTELVKFYQQVTVNPVSVVVTVQAMTKPVILVLSALIWKERTVREQLLWGVLAFIAVLPLFIEDLPQFLKDLGERFSP